MSAYGGNSGLIDKSPRQAEAGGAFLVRADRFGKNMRRQFITLNFQVPVRFLSALPAVGKGLPVGRNVIRARGKCLPAMRHPPTRYRLRCLQFTALRPRKSSGNFLEWDHREGPNGNDQESACFIKSERSCITGKIWERSDVPKTKPRVAGT